MNSIITYLLLIIQYQNQRIRWLVIFLAKYIPLGQWAHDDIHSPKYQKFKTDILPKVLHYEIWDYTELIQYYKERYNYTVKTVRRRSECDIPEDCSCPRCGAPLPYLYKNNGSKGQILCKVCQTRFNQDNKYNQPLKLPCPYCAHALVHKKE